MSKIPFSMEYRPLIESGEYKVEIGREYPWPARIVCWDLNGDNIIAVVMNPEGKEEGLVYTKQGKHNAICPRIDSDLFIIIPEPELTESEDERIRKTLVEYFGPSAQLDFIRGVPIRKIRDWLEKQKEQKPVQFKNNDLVDIIKGEFEGFRTLLKKAGIDYEPQRSYWEGFARLFDSSAREYVREQKSAEWGEEDKEMIERLIRHTQKEFNELCNDRYGHQEIISDLKESCRERMNWLENRLKSLCSHP